MSDHSLPLPKLIGFNGYAQSGKDTLAHYLVSEFGYRRVAFADALRAFITATNPPIAELVNAIGWDVAKLDPDVRQALKDIGAAARDYIHQNVWVFAALGDVASDNLIAVSDVRRPNEADTIKRRGGRLVRVERPGVRPANDLDTMLDRYDRFDAILRNDGTIELLHARMRSILDEWAYAGSGVR